jgi:hypothetical protein
MRAIVQTEKEWAANRSQIADRVGAKGDDDVWSGRRSAVDPHLINAADKLLEIGKRHGFPPQKIFQ